MWRIVENYWKSTLLYGIKPSLKLFRVDYMRENTSKSAQDNLSNIVLEIIMPGTSQGPTRPIQTHLLICQRNLIIFPYIVLHQCSYSPRARPLVFIFRFTETHMPLLFVCTADLLQHNWIWRQRSSLTLLCLSLTNENSIYYWSILKWCT